MNAAMAARFGGCAGRFGLIVRGGRAALAASVPPTVSTIGQAISHSVRGHGRGPGPAGTGSTGRARHRSAADQDSLPVFSTFVISVLALATVEAKGAPCSSDLVMVGRISSVVSTTSQLGALNGEIWVFVAALAKPDMSWLLEYAPPVSFDV